MLPLNVITVIALRARQAAEAIRKEGANLFSTVVARQATEDDLPADEAWAKKTARAGLRVAE